jgi:hypothetical protein
MRILPQNTIRFVDIVLMDEQLESVGSPKTRSCARCRTTDIGKLKTYALLLEPSERRSA